MYFLILVNQFQVALGVRINSSSRDFGNAIQVPDEAHRVVFWHQFVECSRHWRVDPDVRWSSSTSPEFRPAMAALDDGLLHVALAAAFDPLQDGARGRRRRQPGPAHLGGHRRLRQRRGRPRRHSGTPASTITRSEALAPRPTGRVLHHPLACVGPWTAAVRRADSRAFCSGARCSTRCSRTGVMQLIGRWLSRSISASRRSRRISASTSRAFANTASRSRC